MKLLLLAFLGLTLLIGCQDAERQMQETGGQAFESARANLGPMFAKLQADVRGITEQTSKRALILLKEKLVEAQASLANTKGIDAVKLEDIKRDIAKVDAALNVHDLKAKLDGKVHEAMALKENADKTYEDVRDKLDSMDSAYQDLKAKLDSAKKTLGVD